MRKYTGKNLLSILDEAVNGADDGNDDNVLYSLKREFHLPSGYRWNKSSEAESIYYIIPQYVMRHVPGFVSVRNTKRYDTKSHELVSEWVAQYGLARVVGDDPVIALREAATLSRTLTKIWTI